MSPFRLPHFHCPPGTRMVLDVTGLDEKLTTACVGHVRGRFVILQMPALPEIGRETLYQLLYPDNGVIARFLLDGTVVGFSARLIKHIQIPFPLLFITYPKKLESHDLRKHRRVACCIPSQARIKDAPLLGMIVDMSFSGCQFSATFEAQAPEVGIDDMVELHCELFGPKDQGTLPCAVKRVSLSGNRLEIGLKFRTMPPQIQDALDEYLQDALSVLS
jgi:hypothetical protein